MEPIFFSNASVLTEFLGSGGICKKILHFDVSRGLRSQKTPFLSHFTREFGQKLRAIALGGPTTRKSKISSQIIYKCTKPLIPSVKFRGHRTFFPCNKSRLKWRNWDQLLTEYIIPQAQQAETIANMQRGKLLAIERPFTHMFCQDFYKTSVSGFEK